MANAYVANGVQHKYLVFPHRTDEGFWGDNSPTASTNLRSQHGVWSTRTRRAIDPFLICSIEFAVGIL